MLYRSLWRNFDYWLMLAVLALCGIGIAMVYSATITTIDLADYWERQTFLFLVGLAVQSTTVLLHCSTRKLIALLKT